MTLPRCPSSDGPCGWCHAEDTLTHSLTRVHDHTQHKRSSFFFLSSFLTSQRIAFVLKTSCLGWQLCLFYTSQYLYYCLFFFKEKLYFQNYFIWSCVCAHVYGICVLFYTYMCVCVYTSGCVFVHSGVSLFMESHTEAKREHLVSRSITLCLICLIPLRQLPSALLFPPSLFLTSFGNPPASVLPQCGNNRNNRATPGFSRGL